MRRINIHLTSKQYSFLRHISELEDGLSISEQIRRAIDKYIKELTNINVSVSESIPKGGDMNG